MVLSAHRFFFFVRDELIKIRRGFFKAWPKFNPRCLLRLKARVNFYVKYDVQQFFKKSHRRILLQSALKLFVFAAAALNMRTCMQLRQCLPLLVDLSEIPVRVEQILCLIERKCPVDRSNDPSGLINLYNQQQYRHNSR